MKLKNLIRKLPSDLINWDLSYFPHGKEASLESKISDVLYDSRKVIPLSVFVAISGYKLDGNKFIAAAIDKGASVIVVSGKTNLPELQNNKPAQKISRASYLVVQDCRKALAHLSAALFDFPWQKMDVIGITGTNGKTSISYILDIIWQSAKLDSAVIGTIEYRWPGTKTPSRNTTPESRDLTEMLDKIYKKGVSTVALEVSSHALSLSRVDAFAFRLAIFTNLTQDHLDFHKDMEEYFLAKRKLFAPEILTGAAIINIDTPYGNRIAEFARSSGRKVYSFATDLKNDTEDGFLLINLSCKMAGTSFSLIFPQEPNIGKREVHHFFTHLKGKFNAINTALAIIACVDMAIDIDIIKAAVSQKDLTIPGRFEVIRTAYSQDFLVIVDYAHTPDALENIIKEARQMNPQRIITLFGCGGDRDRGKRPLMGEIAARLSDWIFVTSDNPRSEDPLKIIQDIESGITNYKKNHKVIPARKAAIHQAVKFCKKGDILIIAGKGHEDYQIIGEEKVHFDDREIARKALEQ